MLKVDITRFIFEVIQSNGMSSHNLSIHLQKKVMHVSCQFSLFCWLKYWTSHLTLYFVCAYFIVRENVTFLERKTLVMYSTENFVLSTPQGLKGDKTLRTKKIGLNTKKNVIFHGTTRKFNLPLYRNWEQLMPHL